MTSEPTKRSETQTDITTYYERKLSWMLGRMFLDSIAWALALVVAFMLRYSVLLNQRSVLDVIDAQALAINIALAAVLQVGFGLWYKVYRRDHEYGSFEEILLAGAAVVATGLGLFAWSYLDELLHWPHLPHSVPLISMAFALMLMAGMRMAKRTYVEWRLKKRQDGEPVIIYGAGLAGRLVIQSMIQDRRSKVFPVAIIDDNPRLLGAKVHGIPVRGNIDNLDQLIDELHPKKVIVAISKYPKDTFDVLWERMRERGIEARRIASTTQRLVGDDTVYETDDSEIMQLVRGEINYEVDDQLLSSYITGKRVLVTGAGGSIGSELCRQIHRFNPQLLMMLDRDETLLMDTKLSITGESSLDDERIILADIREGENLRKIFMERKPDIVFHAAALKHVSALEAYPEEAWKTNTLGTLNVLRAAEASGVGTLVNVSTDKAADPTTALGQSKRAAECLTAWFGHQTGRKYVSVRFGNVFGSRGSIKPLFTRQIESGGPITLTHKDATRYFMLIPDACLLVMLAGKIGRPGDVMVLDMGDPVHIYDVAREMRKAYGRYDVEIVLTGLRKGEKLGEVLFGHGEHYERSAENRYISHSTAPALDPDTLDYDTWLRDYEEHRGYERHGLERAPDLGTARRITR